MRPQLALLRSDPRFGALQKRIVEFATLLEGLANVPMVQAELELIQEIETDAYWQDVTAPMLETLRRRLRSLIKLIEVKKRTIIYTDFTDEIGIGSGCLSLACLPAPILIAFGRRRGNFSERTKITSPLRSCGAMSR